jgi:hypothetical protein
MLAVALAWPERAAAAARPAARTAGSEPASPLAVR